jgi:hypothetical protein
MQTISLLTIITLPSREIAIIISMTFGSCNGARPQKQAILRMTRAIGASRPQNQGKIRTRFRIPVKGKRAERSASATL